MWALVKKAQEFTAGQKSMFNSQIFWESNRSNKTDTFNPENTHTCLYQQYV